MKSKLKMRLILIVLLYTCCHTCICQADTPIAVNNSDARQDDGLYESSVESVSGTTLKAITNCSLVPKFPDVRNKIATLANAGNKLVKINLEVVGDNGPLNDTYPGSIYNSHQWVISTSLTGNAMLMLKEYFDAMSLKTLGHGVASVSLTLIQIPEDCLEDAVAEDIENSSHAGFGVDKSNLKWKNMFTNAVQNYADRWNFEDIYVTHTEETDVTPKATGTVREISETARTEFQYSTDDNAANEASIHLLSLQECTHDGNIDLIVEEHVGKKALIFYVPNPSGVHVTSAANNTDDVTIV